VSPKDGANNPPGTIIKSLVEWLFYLAGDGRFELPQTQN